MSELSAEQRLKVLRPHRHLFTQGISAFFIIAVPVFIVFYWLTAPYREWLDVVSIAAGFVVVAGLATMAFLSTTIRLTSYGVRERSYFGRVVRIRKEAVGAMLLIDVYQNSTLDTKPQLFVSDRNGALLLRMRGQFWSRDNMNRVAEQLETPIQAPEAPVTVAQLRRTHPSLLYWFEKFPWDRSRQPQG
jgi:hypothetical protein